MKQEEAKPKPKLQFCWHCGKKLRANFYREYLNPNDGQVYIVHRLCLETIKTGFRTSVAYDDAEFDNE